MFPDLKQTVIDEIREMDFGAFEAKNHKMLNGDPDYQAWLDSGGYMKIPGGESIAVFKERILEGLKKAVQIARNEGADNVYIVAHGGTLMAAMSSLTGEDYFDFNVPNGMGYCIELEADDAGNIVAAGSYDRFCGGLRDGYRDWRPPQYTPSGEMDR
jgi:alpha-ribazole phosphatase